MNTRRVYLNPVEKDPIKHNAVTRQILNSMSEGPQDFGVIDAGDFYTITYHWGFGYNIPGPHIGTPSAAFLVSAVPEGSGQNGPASADNGLAVVAAKKNYNVARANTVHGEIDAAFIFLRNTGPTDGTLGDAARSDSVGLAVNSYNWGLTGFNVGSEMVVGNIANDGTTVLKEIDIQIGAINADTTFPYANGFDASADIGVLDNAYLVNSGGGTWAWGLHALAGTISSGGFFLAYDTQFYVADTGHVTLYNGLSTRFAAVTLVNGLNSDISNNGTVYKRITGPSAGFSVGGFGLGSGGDGSHLILYNSTAQAMTIVNEDLSSTDIKRFKTLTGGNVVLRAGTSAASFIYDITETRWILVSSN